MGAIEFLCDARFHQSFVLPPNPDAGRSRALRVSFADYGDCQSDAVVLFCGALMGSRLCYSPLDQLAKTYKVRIIHPDRPGIGGTDPVELNERVGTWLEIVPRLLSHLGIAHVSLASHSGGDIYLLNTILTYPHLLHPASPYVAFFAPWVHHSRSGVNSMRATELLPAPLIGRFASVARFVNNNVIPLAGLSGSFLQGMKNSFQHSLPAPAPVSLSPTSSASQLPRTNSMSSMNRPSVGIDLDDPTVVEELRQLITSYLFAENMDGISADAQLFLKKPHSTEWCSTSVYWSDIDYAVPLLRKMIDDDNRDNRGGRKWHIEAFHAQEDDMVGEKGRTWFDACWKPAQTPSTTGSPTLIPGADDVRDENLSYKSEIVPLTDHNYIMDPAYEGSEKWLRRVRAAFPPPAEEEEMEEDELSSLASSSSFFLQLKRRHHFSSIVSKAKRAMRRRRPKATLATVLESPATEPLLGSTDSFDDCSTRAWRRGRMAYGVRIERVAS